MSTKTEVKMKQALIGELVELLESTGFMRNVNPPTQEPKIYDVMHAHTITYTDTKEILTLTKATAKLNCFSAVQFFGYKNSENCILDLTQLTTEKLQSIKLFFEDLITKTDNQNKGICSRNKVVHYLNNLEKPINGFDAVAFVQNMDDLRNAERHPTTNNKEKRHALALEIAITAYDLSSDKHKHRALGVLIIAALVLISPVVIAWLPFFLDGNPAKKKLSTGEKVVNYIADKFKEANALSKASKSITFFVKQVQKPAGKIANPHLNTTVSIKQ